MINTINFKTMTLKQQQKREERIDNEREKLSNDFKILLDNAGNMSVSQYYRDMNDIKGKIIDNNEQKIECLKAQIKLLTN